ncbi:MAG: hypothetical protein HUK04_07530 [Bacteroidaceae bacterium]|uniref:hypothetical protein n=1 Tax=Fusobacterium varium TaxID=856 RepID=UPI00242DEA0D|nr:hypothetical protein [Fusobacterium varium]MCF0171610.1 hypothetical protein [Fusobacterium varium]MCF0189323.1 hypothetical protein [Bacteroidaceae bacterium]
MLNKEAIEIYKTLEEAINKARELNGIIQLAGGLSVGTYDYCIKIHRENGKRFYSIMRTDEALKDKKLKKAEVKGRTKEIIKMRNKGFSYEKIAEEIGTHTSVVYTLYQEAIEEEKYVEMQKM